MKTASPEKNESPPHFPKSKGWILAILLPAFSASLTNAQEPPDFVMPGYDLFHTLPGTTFMGVPFEGVNLGTFLGSNAGNTDTIIHRTGTATEPSGTVPIEIVALQLVSTAPVSLGGGPLGFYYATLASGQTPGSMTINFTEPPTGVPDVDPDIDGTFIATLPVHFDIHFGSLDGPVVLSGTEIFNSEGSWSDNPNWPISNQVLIKGVNSLLNGTDPENDFYPFPITEIAPNPPSIHQVEPATGPDGGATGLLLLAGIAAIAVVQRRSCK